MESANAKRARLLGEPFGTANNKLRKLLLFSLVQKTGQDTCYRCGLKIKSIDSFSIEHTIPWQGTENPRETFFDLSKISYSHISCNSKASYKGKREIIDGLAWCSYGQHRQPIELFIKNKESSDGLASHCKPCHIKSVDKSRRLKGIRPKEVKYTKSSKYT